MSWLIKKILTDKKGRISLKKIITITLLVFLFLLGSSRFFGPKHNSLDAAGQVKLSWFSHYGYRRAILISNTGSSALSDQDIKVIINTKELSDTKKLKANGQDMRFTASDGTSELPFWIKTEDSSTATSCIIWLRVIGKDSIPVGTSVIYLYYGNRKAEAASNASIFGNIDDTKENMPNLTVDVYAEQENL